MAIHFEADRWKKIKEDYTLWWEGKLERPLIKAVVKSAYAPDRKAPKAPLLSMRTCNQLQYTPEEVVDALDYELSQCEFLGDAFPFLDFAAFGPGALAGFCGAGLDNSTGGVWYFPKEKMSLDKLHIRYDPENVWARRIKDIYKAGRERWGGNVLMSFPDLGGIQDVLAIFLGNEEYMFALYDEPEEVERLQGEAREAFLAAYKDLEEALHATETGYANWTGIYSTERGYVFQDDFAYMIGTDMFEEFALGDISCLKKEISRVIYHLDGVGNLKHLDLLLDNTDIQAYQWVYGAGQPSARHWMEVYEKLYQRGKGMEIVGSPEDFDYIAERIPKGLYYHLTVDDKEGNARKNQDAKDCLSDYHIVEYDKSKEVEALLRRWRG